MTDRIEAKVVAAALAIGLMSATAGNAIAAEPKPGDFTLTIIHTNDVHDRVEPVTAFNNTCRARDRDRRRCYGGYARLMTLIQDLRAKAANPLVLSGGDQFQGSLFYRTHKGALAAKAMNLIGYDATAVGNHEFDDGPATFARFVRAVRFPVVSTNIDARADPHLKGLIKPAVVLTVGGQRIGIVGYTVEDTAILSKPGRKVRFARAEAVLPAAIARLKAQGVDKIVAVSHAGFYRDKRVAAAVDGIDVIVGGHTNTLLGNGVRGASGPYPVVVKSPSGAPVLVVQAAAYSRFVGRLEVTFDGKGVARRWSGNPIPVGFEIAKHPKMEALIAAHRGPVDALRRQVVGRLSTGLDGSGQTCRQRECTMGIVVAEALLRATRAQGTEIAIMNGGGVRASLAKGPVTMGEVMVVLPFQNTIATLKLTGADIRAALEHGVSQAEELAGRFPQVAGLRFVWDPKGQAGQRIVSVDVRVGDRWTALDPKAVYKVVTNDYLRAGGDGYRVFKEKAIEPYDGGANLEDAVAAYIGANSPLRGRRDGRARRVGETRR